MRSSHLQTRGSRGQNVQSSFMLYVCTKLYDLYSYIGERVGLSLVEALVLCNIAYVYILIEFNQID